MKKHLKSGLFSVMAVLLLMPVYSMADMKFTVMTPEGYSVTSSDAVIKNFFMTSEGLTVIVNGGIVFDSGVDIGLQTMAGVDIGNVVETTVGTPVSFKVVSDTQGAAFTASIPVGCGTFISPNYSWPNPTVEGNYLAVFTAAANNKTSTLIALIKVNPPGYTLTITQSAGGTISAPKISGFSATSPETIQVTATPAQGYQLTSWGGALSGTTNPAPLLMNGDKTVTATFATATLYALTVSATAGGTATGGGNYSEGQHATITATPTPGAGYTFTGWSGGATGTANPLDFTMPANPVTVTANFSNSGPGPTGEWTDEVNSATKANTKNMYGDWSAMGISISRGSTSYFLIEPKAVGATAPPPIGVFYLQPVIEELGLAMVITSGLNCQVLKLSSNNDLLGTTTVPPGTGGMQRALVRFNLTEYNAGVKFLVKVAEPNQGSSTINVKWR